MDTIVKKVLFQLGEINRALILDGLEYSSEILDALKKQYFIENAASIEELLKLCMNEIKPERTFIIIPSLSCKVLMATYLGIGGDIISDALLVLLLRGIKVYVFEEAVELLSIQSPMTPLVIRHQEALKDLKQSGLSIITKEFSIQDNQKVCQMVKENSQIIRHMYKLLNEQHIRSYERSGECEVHIAKGTIITPLAQDYLRQSHVKIVKG